MPKKIVLVIDDEPEILSVIAKRLIVAGYEVVTAKDGVEGLTKAANLKPDIVLLDILLPKMDGYEVCRLLKFDEKNKSIPVIMLSAKTQDVDKEMGKKVNADDYVTKPFDAQDLILRIKKLTGEAISPA